MRSDRFKALVAKERGGGQSIAIEEITESDLSTRTAMVIGTAGLTPMLCGVDSVRCPADRRIAAWNRCAALLNADDIDALANEVGLGDLPDHILKGQMKGRTLANVRI